MGAIFFYIFIYFVGYYGSNIFNMFTVRPLITNRYLAALVPVVGVAFLHGYMIVSKPPPASQNITVESALFTYVLMPVVIVTLGAIYFMWNAQKPAEDMEEAEEDKESKEEVSSIEPSDRTEQERTDNTQPDSENTDKADDQETTKNKPS